MGSFYDQHLNSSKQNKKTDKRRNSSFNFLPTHSASTYHPQVKVLEYSLDKTFSHLCLIFDMLMIIYVDTPPCTTSTLKVIYTARWGVIILNGMAH